MFLSALSLFSLLLSLVMGAPAAVPMETPVRNWGPSWAASCARGTSMVVSCRVVDSTDKHKNEDEHSSSDVRNNGILLLLRSTTPPTVATKLQYQKDLLSSSTISWTELPAATLSTSNFTDVSPMRLEKKPLEEFRSVMDDSHGCFWTPFGASALCAMTGLSSDVTHLCRVVQRRVHTHRTDYDVSPMATSSLTQAMSRTVRESTMAGRPFGLQALVVGKQQHASSNNNPPLHVYSIDPSGAWRCWGSGCTAIGKLAESIRRHLYGGLVASSSSNPNNNIHPQVAMEIAMQASVTASQEASLNQDNDQYDAVLFWVDDVTGACQVATVDPQWVQDCRDRVTKSLLEEQV
ncbi:expressed unknown protein [Seminavis robusta]|uniref:Uncharacterized protein n=1 Tax=Seminavis robusta TaxID=568900 RepID=A0A9N8ESP5_9STRA|nr:expressed unknown protein [Seminavis robusta]|eukprot:Sro1835_g300550.1 n/a (349) ;mRNA; f:880-1926